jgi:ubiquinone/menaquinone biosynthesis C-methylase UbiE
VHNPKKMLGAYVRPGMTVMDVGCGMGVFSIGMARLVGAEGRVLAVDLQEPMLRVLRRRAERAGVSERIETVLCGADDLGVSAVVDFVLAFYMVHETPDVRAFLRQLRARLKPEGRLLVAEPTFHVSETLFQETLEAAADAGLAALDRPKIRMSRSALFGVASS